MRGTRIAKNFGHSCAICVNIQQWYAHNLTMKEDVFGHGAVTCLDEFLGDGTVSLCVPQLGKVACGIALADVGVNSADKISGAHIFCAIRVIG